VAFDLADVNMFFKNVPKMEQNAYFQTRTDIANGLVLKHFVLKTGIIPVQNV